MFEGLLGIHTDVKARAKFTTMMKLHRFHSAIRTFTLNEMMQRVIWDVVFRYDYGVDVVTFLDERLVDDLTEYLDEQGLPVGHIWQSEKLLLARSLNYRPDVAGVFYPDPTDRFAFGSKGYFTDPADPILIGVLGHRR